MNSIDIQKLHIPEAHRSARGWSAPLIFGAVALVLLIASWLAWPRKSDAQRIVNRRATLQTEKGTASSAASSPASSFAQSTDSSPGTTQIASKRPGNILLTTSGYIVNRERIELSPRFTGTVHWMGVRKGDTVTKGQIIVLLEDSEQRARLLQAEGSVARNEAALVIAQARNERLKKLLNQHVDSEQQFDDSVAELGAAEAGIREAKGQLDYARTQLEWTVIRSPIDGVVLDKLAHENELVSPQSFGGTGGPSTALVAIADPNDLQVEVDLNEADLAKVTIGQSCCVTPEAYPDHSYDGEVVEIAPEANRQKGTLQVKVQIKNPDHFLIPEFSGKVDFLAGPASGLTRTALQ